MTQHTETGKTGEELAANWLIENGFTLLHQNWRYSHFEIDIIATKNDTVHFIEVKTRRSNTYGEPEQAVSKQKLTFIIKAAAIYLERNPSKKVQFDVLAITLLYNQPPKYFFIEDVYTRKKSS